MIAAIEITPAHWVGFLAVVGVFLALDLGVFHRQAREVRFREALGWTSLWVTLSLGFALLLVPLRGRAEAEEFLLGYFIELSLSIDNVFVIALIFNYFRVPRQYQHRVLFWGILGALFLRGVMIHLGATLIGQFHWLLHVLGAFLVYTGVKMLIYDDEDVHPERNWVVRRMRAWFRITPHFEGQRFVTTMDGRRALTPLALVLVMVETCDLVFAVDSIPAIFGVTQKAFIVFTSNVFAILGLRSLYFVLVGAIDYFRYLKVGLAIVLVFIGGKMLLSYFGVTISAAFSMGLVFGILLVSMLFSVMIARRENLLRDRGTS